MEDFVTDQRDSIHLLFKGSYDDLNLNQDEYLEEFKLKNLKATVIPVLEFQFKNLDHFTKLIKTAKAAKKQINGLIVTSPRVVEALYRAAKIYGQNHSDFLAGFDSDFVFVVGEKSGLEFRTKLGFKFNNRSTECGNARTLAEFILTYCQDRSTVINLLYPKGSRSDNLIEEILARTDRIRVETVVVYETRLSEDILSRSIRAIGALDHPRKSKLILNLIFFSPSGVDAFTKIDQDIFTSEVKSRFSSGEIEVRYSCIGKTTETALTNHRLNVYAVAQKPNPSSLVARILEKTNPT